MEAKLNVDGQRPRLPKGQSECDHRKSTTGERPVRSAVRAFEAVDNEEDGGTPAVTVHLIDDVIGPNIS